MTAWRSWPKVSPARSGGANTKRYTPKRRPGTMAPGECDWCHQEATRLCDTMLRGRTTSGDLDLFRIDGPTCDANLCDDCAESTQVFMSGPDEHCVEFIDKCPYCQVRAGHRGKGWGSSKETHFVSATLWRERRAEHAAKAKRSAGL